MENSNRLIEEEVEKEFNEKLVKIIQRARINNNTPQNVFVDDIKEIILKKVSEARQETLKEVEEIKKEYIKEVLLDFHKNRLEGKGYDFFFKLSTDLDELKK